MNIAKQQHRQSSWWFQPTHLKNMLVKLDHFPKVRGANKKYLETPPRFHLFTLQASLLSNADNISYQVFDFISTNYIPPFAVPYIFGNQVDRYLIYRLAWEPLVPNI